MNKKDKIPKFTFKFLVEDSYLFNLKRKNKDNSDYYTFKDYKTYKKCKLLLK